MFHPDFPPQEPYFDLPRLQHGSCVGDLHIAVARALILAIENGHEPRELGLRLANLIEAAIERQDATSIEDTIGIYEKLCAAPIDVLKILHNSFLVDLEGRIGEYVGPA